MSIEPMSVTIDLKPSFILILVWYSKTTECGGVAANLRRHSDNHNVPYFSVSMMLLVRVMIRTAKTCVIIIQKLNCISRSSE